MQHAARYAVTFGLAGCYLPDSYGGVFEFHTRHNLVEFVKSELEIYDFPKSAIRQIPFRSLWRKIQFAKSSSVCHFSIDHGGYSLSFHGLTEEEYEAQKERD